MVANLFKNGDDVSPISKYNYGTVLHIASINKHI